MQKTEHNQTADVEPESTRHTPGVYCHEVKYFDGDTLSVSSVKSKPRETICILLGLKRQRDELLEMLKEMALVSVWGRSHPLLAKAQDLIQKSEAGQ